MLTRTHRLVLISLAVMVLGLCVGVGCYGWYLRQTGQHLRDDLLSLTGNGAGHSDLLRLADKYARFRVPASFVVSDLKGVKYSYEPNDPCVVHSCVVDFEISNRLLSRIHLAKPSRFLAVVIELDNRIVYVEMVLDGVEQERGVGAQTTYVIPDTPVSEIFDLSSRPPYSFTGPYGKPHMRTILSASATSEQKEKATAFNMSCLTSITGCHWPCDYLPFAWKDYQDVLPADIVEGMKSSGSKCAW